MADDKLRVEIAADSGNLQSGIANASDALSNAVEIMTSQLEALNKTSQEQLTMMVAQFNNLSGTIKGASDESQGALSRMANAVKDSLAPLEAGMKSVIAPLWEVKEAIVGLLAPLAGLTELFKKAGEEQTNWVTDSIKLARGFGITAEEASALKVAVAEISATYLTGEVSSDTLLNAFKRFAMQIAQNREMLEGWGIHLKNDVTGQMRNSFDVFMEAVKHLQSLHGMTAVTADAAKLFGRNISDLLPVLMHLSQDGLEEARKKADKLGLTVGVEGVARVQASKKASQEMHEAWQSLAATLSKVVIPAMTALVGTMAGIIDIINKVVTALGRFISFGDRAADGAKRVNASMSSWGKWTGETKPPEGLPKDMMPKHEATGGEPSDREAKDRLATWRQQLEQQKEASSDFFKSNLAAELAFWEERLNLCKKGSKDWIAVQHEIYQINREEAQENLAAAVADLKAQESNERAGWDARLDAAGRMINLMAATYGKDSAKYKEACTEKTKLLEKEVEDQIKLELKNAENHAKTEAAMAASTAKRIETGITLSNKEYESKAKDIESAYKTGEMSASRETQLLIENENRRYQAEHDGLLKIMGQYGEGEAEFEKYQKDLELAVQKHTDNIVAYVRKGAEEQKKLWKDVASEVSGPFESAFKSAGEGMLEMGKKGQTMQQTMLKAVQQLVQGFMNLIEKIVMAIAKQEAFNALGKGEFGGSEGIGGIVTQALGMTGGAGSQAALSTAGATLTTAGTSLNAAAAQLYAAAGIMAAGGGGGGALGDLGDVATMSTFSFDKGGNVPKATRGWDLRGAIPAFLHSEEMVLPEHIANPLRAMIAAGGYGGRDADRSGRGGGGNNYGHTFNVSSIGPKDAAAAVKQALRRGYR